MNKVAGFLKASLIISLSLQHIPGPFIIPLLGVSVALTQGHPSFLPCLFWQQQGWQGPTYDINVRLLGDVGLTYNIS